MRILTGSIFIFVGLLFIFVCSYTGNRLLINKKYKKGEVKTLKVLLPVGLFDLLGLGMVVLGVLRLMGKF